MEMYFIPIEMMVFKNILHAEVALSVFIYLYFVCRFSADGPARLRWRCRAPFRTGIRYS